METAEHAPSHEFFESSAHLTASDIAEQKEPHLAVAVAGSALPLDRSSNELLASTLCAIIPN
jgi:hypothetical protein